MAYPPLSSPSDYFPTMLQFTPLWTRSGAGAGASAVGRSKRQAASSEPAAAPVPLGGGTYRTLQRIVTVHPLSGHGSGGGPSPLPVGEITTTVEEYYPGGLGAPGGPSPRSVAAATAGAADGQEQDTDTRPRTATAPLHVPTHPPLYRRVAVRRGAGHVHGDGGIGGRGSGDGKAKEDAAAAMGDLMAGNPSTIDASYELPVLPLGTVRTMPPPPQQQQEGQHGADGIYADPIVCWASFGSTRRRKQLCVLAGPSLLRIFDVYPSPGHGNHGSNTATGSSGGDTGGDDDDDDDDSDDDVAGAGGGEGHSVTLPFECAGIYPMPDEVGGLLLQRAAEAEERVQQEEVRRLYFADHLGDGGGGGPSLLDRQLSQEESSQESGSLAEALRRPPRAVRVEGSLTDVLMGDDGEETIEDSLSDVAARAGDAAAAAAASAGGNGGVVVDGFGIGTLARTVGSAGFCGVGGGVPSVFSLLHPLDEVRPVALVPPFADDEVGIDNSSAKCNDANNMATNGDMVDKNTDANATDESRSKDAGSTLPDLVGAFSDVNERLMFIGRPRNLCPSLTSSSSRNRVDTTVLVTYHTQRRRHAVWAVGAAPPPPDVLPLWKRTAASRRRAAEAGGLAARRIDAIAVNDGEGGERGGNDGAVQPPASTMDEGWILLDDGASPNFTGRQGIASPRQPLPPAFGELHPTLTLSLLYEEEMEGHGGSFGEANDAFMFAGRRFFLSTNADGSADSILCWVQKNRKGPKNGNYSILRRMNIARFQKQSKDDYFRRASDHPFLLPDIRCEDAAPILSSLIPEPTFDFGSKARTGFGAVSSPRSIDTLVYSVDEGSPSFPASSSASLALYREGIEISECFIDNFCENNQLPIGIKISDPICDKVTLQLPPSLTGQAGKCVRAALGLVMTSALAEATLGAIEASLTTLLTTPRISEAIEVRSVAGLVLSIRTDCVRYAQRSGFVGKAEMVEDLNWLALSTILFALFDELARSWTGGNGGDGQERRSIADESARGTSDWETLLASDFHAQYIRDFDNLLPLEQSPPAARSATASIEGTASTEHVHQTIPSTLFWLDQIASSSPKESLLDFARILFDSLHLFYEDCKLCRNARGRSWSAGLGQLLHKLCHREYAVGSMGDFIDYYHRDGFLGVVSDEDAFTPSSRMMAITRLSAFERPPSLFSWVDAKLRGDDEITYPYRAAQNGSADKALCPPASRTLCRLLSMLCANGDERGNVDVEDTTDSFLGHQSVDRKLVLLMISEGVIDPLTLRNELPPGVALPFMESLRRCRSDPPSPCARKKSGLYFPPEAFYLIGRSDLARIQMQIDIAARRRNEKSKKRKVEKKESSPSPTGLGSTQRTSIGTAPDPDQDGLGPLAASTAMLYPNDTRIQEVARLLRSSRPSYLRVPRAVEVSDHDYERLKQEKLLLLCRRKMAQPLGRGMATLCTLDSAGPMHSTSAVPAEPVQLPKLSLAGRVAPSNATLALDTSNCPSDMSVWPEFHNGVAAGLRLPKAGDVGSGQITRTWIVYNRPGANPTNPAPPTGNNTNSQPTSQDHTHAGLLFALGLHGHLSALSMTDVYDYLTQGTVTTTVGILLGMSACKKGTCDQSVSKMLCLHIPSLLPPSFATMEVAPPARTAAVAGIGLLYMRSGHRLMTEFLLGEIGRRPRSDAAAAGREGYALCCGLALGLVNLSKGSSESEGSGGGAGLSDLRIDERLHRYVVGGPEDPETRSKRDASDRAAAGLGAGGASGLSSDQEQCSCIFEGENINTDVSAPGATLCLGLMYLQSGNKSVAARLALPDTHFLLDYVRPDLLMLRVIARSLILWDDVRPTSEWIDDQIPGMVKRAFGRMIAKAENMAGFAGLANFANMRMNPSPHTKSSADTSSATGRQHVDGGSDEENTNTSRKSTSFVANANHIEKQADDDDTDVDRQAIRQAHVHVIAGACFGMGLRYAGSGNEDAAAAITERLEHLIRLRDESDAVSVALKPERPILEMCLNSVAVSLAMVMAGTGDVGTFKLLRAIRWRCDGNIRYGTHMAIGSAIGLLFLGGGTCTLGTEPEDIAALLLAFFPRFPINTTDNQYHLQALRHCYVLAVKRRLLEAIDIDTKEKVFVPLEVTLDGKSGAPMKLTAPCLLLNKGNYSHLRVMSERYYPASLDLQVSTKSDSNLALFVKKKSGHLSYVQDPHAHRSLLVQTGGSGGGSAVELIQAFTEDKKLLAYAKYLCDDGKKRQRKKRAVSLQDQSGLHLSFEEFCTEILHECLTKEKTEAIRLYIALRHAIRSAENGAWSVESMWDIRLVRSYYEGIQQAQPSPATSPVSPLLNEDFVAALSESIDGQFAEKGLTGTALMSYLESGGNWGAQDKGLMGCFLTYHDVPFPGDAVDGSADIE